ncbi:phosphatase PAP2 family protein [Tritonibacter horizontis]|uniref:PAP2 superfamily protein n=1 Tax=Tritonibacter horizontis TaxID=1768241 RepID=A0A132BWF7_9RHOB|nr:phosphatase PAP2 family protein [Tritonibacter horizontis]KUP92392.1 PAP2 superfamily protein [Tritonibacter horizontis]
MFDQRPDHGEPVLTRPRRPARRSPDRLRRLALWVVRQFGAFLILAILLVCMSFANRSVERIGDNIQIALPLAGLGCAVAEGRGVQYFGRFILMEFAIHGSKAGLGKAPLNQRPNGGDKGFPSGHMTASAFGATALVQGCLAANKTAQAAVVISAGFVGTSRVEAGAHTIWQVVAGAALGWMLQIASLAAFDRAFRRLWLGAAAAVSTVRRAVVSRLPTRSGDRSGAAQTFGLGVAVAVALAAGLAVQSLSDTPQEVTKLAEQSHTAR